MVLVDKTSFILLEKVAKEDEVKIPKNLTFLVCFKIEFCNPRIHNNIIYGHLGREGDNDRHLWAHP